ncbi:MAG: isoleucyl-tRNA synthetase, partial [Salibacteraceae bacterium]
EGLARELVNRIQNLRKDSGFEVTDRINVNIAKNEFLQLAVKNNLDYIRTETLTDELNFSASALPNGLEVELEEGLVTQLEIEKI